MTGCEVITCLGGNELKVSSRKGYVPKLVIIKFKYEIDYDNISTGINR